MFDYGFGRGGHCHGDGFMYGQWFMHRGRGGWGAWGGGGGNPWDEGAGRGGRGPLGGGGRGRVFGPGDLRLLLLSLIEEKPRHGYELIKELEQKFGGGYAPSPGSVYPTLTLLEELGLVSATATTGTRRLFTITEEGRRFLQENAAAVDSARARMDMAARAVSGDMPPREVFHAVHVLRAALMFHRGGWDAAEAERVCKILEDAAEAISKGRAGG
jgi:DNA-binding PadR family transcriptional regulator